MNIIKRKDAFFKVCGILGLILLLLIFSLVDYYSRKPVQTVTHDHSDPMQHGADLKVDKLNNEDTALALSGKLEDGKRVVNYEAFQYGFSPDPLVVEAGEEVVLKLKSRDVKHGMMIPEIDFTTDIPSQKTKTVSFKAPEAPGKYPIFCSVYCGANHGNMKGTLIVIPKEKASEHEH